MKTVLSLVLTLCFLAVLPSPARAQGWCTNADLVGNHASLLRGHFINLPGVPIVGPIARVALAVFDGNGNLNVTFERGMYAGLPVTQPFTGTYTVGSDCSYQMVVLPPPPINFPVPFAGALFDNKRQAHVMVMGPGAVISGTIERMGINWCSNSTLLGGYDMSMEGTVLAPASAAGPFNSTGRVVFDGEGGFRASGAANTNGTVGPIQFSGAYSVAAQCSVSLTFQTNVSNTFEGVITDRGKKVFLLQTAPAGFGVVTGVLQSQ